jgi:hypothetical protein
VVVAFQPRILSISLLAAAVVAVTAILPAIGGNGIQEAEAARALGGGGGGLGYFPSGDGGDYCRYEQVCDGRGCGYVKICGY